MQAEKNEISINTKGNRAMADGLFILYPTLGRSFGDSRMRMLHAASYPSVKTAPQGLEMAQATSRII